MPKDNHFSEVDPTHPISIEWQLRDIQERADIEKKKQEWKEGLSPVDRARQEAQEEMERGISRMLDRVPSAGTTSEEEARIKSAAAKYRQGEIYAGREFEDATAAMDAVRKVSAKIAAENAVMEQRKQAAMPAASQQEQAPAPAPQGRVQNIASIETNDRPEELDKAEERRERVKRLTALLNPDDMTSEILFAKIKEVVYGERGDAGDPAEADRRRKEALSGLGYDAAFLARTGRSIHEEIDRERRRDVSQLSANEITERDKRLKFLLGFTTSKNPVTGRMEHHSNLSVGLASELVRQMRKFSKALLESSEDNTRKALAQSDAGELTPSEVERIATVLRDPEYAASRSNQLTSIMNMISGEDKKNQYRTAMRLILSEFTDERVPTSNAAAIEVTTPPTTAPRVATESARQGEAETAGASESDARERAQRSPEQRREDALNIALQTERSKYADQHKEFLKHIRLWRSDVEGYQKDVDEASTSPLGAPRPGDNDIHNRFYRNSDERMSYDEKHAMARVQQFRTKLEKKYGAERGRVVADFELSRIDYEGAKSAYAKELNSRKEAEFRAAGKTPREIRDGLKIYQAGELFKKFVIDEQGLLREAKVEGYPPKKKSTFRKAAEWYTRQNKWVRLAGTTALMTGVTGATIGFAGAGVLGAASFAGWRLARGAGAMVVGQTAGVMTGKGVDLVWKKALGRKEEMDKKINELQSNFSLKNLQKLSQEYSEAIEKYERSERRRQKVKIAAMVGAGIGSVYGLGWLARLDAAPAPHDAMGRGAGGDWEPRQGHRGMVVHAQEGAPRFSGETPKSASVPETLGATKAGGAAVEHHAASAGKPEVYTAKDVSERGVRPMPDEPESVAVRDVNSQNPELIRQATPPPPDSIQGPDGTWYPKYYMQHPEEAAARGYFVKDPSTLDMNKVAEIKASLAAEAAATAAEKAAALPTATIEQGGNIWKAAYSMVNEGKISKEEFAEAWGHSTVNIDGKDVPLYKANLSHAHDQLQFVKEPNGDIRFKFTEGEFKPGLGRAPQPESMDVLKKDFIPARFENMNLKPLRSTFPEAGAETADQSHGFEMPAHEESVPPSELPSSGGVAEHLAQAPDVATTPTGGGGAGEAVRVHAEAAAAPEATPALPGRMMDAIEHDIASKSIDDQLKIINKFGNEFAKHPDTPYLKTYLDAFEQKTLEAFNNHGINKMTLFGQERLVEALEKHATKGPLAGFYHNFVEAVQNHPLHRQALENYSRFWKNSGFTLAEYEKVSQMKTGDFMKQYGEEISKHLLKERGLTAEMIGHRRTLGDFIKGIIRVPFNQVPRKMRNLPLGDFLKLLP